jgi:hypothetical protein
VGSVLFIFQAFCVFCMSLLCILFPMLLVSLDWPYLIARSFFSKEKTNRTLFYAEIMTDTKNSELRTWRHIFGQKWITQTPLYKRWFLLLDRMTKLYFSVVLACSHHDIISALFSKQSLSLTFLSASRPSNITSSLYDAMQCGFIGHVWKIRFR